MAKIKCDPSKFVTRSMISNPHQNVKPQESSAEPCEWELGADSYVRKLSPRDSQHVIERLRKPGKPNAALKAAARKYWSAG